MSGWILNPFQAIRRIPATTASSSAPPTAVFKVGSFLQKASKFRSQEIWHVIILTQNGREVFGLKDGSPKSLIWLFWELLQCKSGPEHARSEPLSFLLSAC